MNDNDIEYIVTAIKDISSKRRLVYINYEPAFSLYHGEIRKFQIKEGRQLDSDSYEEITGELLPKRAIVRTMNLLQSKDYSESELYKKLKQGYYPDGAVNAAIEYVKSFGYVDDNRYAENYVNFKSGNKSRRQIEQFLNGKGIDKDIINQVCNDFYSDNEDVELNQILDQMRRKLAKQDELDYNTKMKVMGFFYRKGYSSDSVKKALDIISEERYNV